MKVIGEIKRLQSGRAGPIVVALDGGSGAGKSTLAAMVASEIEAAIIPLDDFFAADIPDNQWDQFTTEEKLRRVLDWQRVRASALVPLRARKPAQWYAFDFAAGLQADGTYRMQAVLTEREPAEVILLDGAYSASPPLADLIDLAALVDMPMEGRHGRLALREDRAFLEAWHARWDPVETYYFSQVRPPDSFDLVV